jgi:hypothetical protein
MTIEFLRDYGRCRLNAYEPQPPLEDEPTEDEERRSDPDNLSYELDRNSWIAIDIRRPADWSVSSWIDRPVRFIDGKDVGETIAWVRAPGGYPVPIRLAQIGAAAMRVIDGRCHRDFQLVETVVSMVQDPFPWREIESFATALQSHGYRLLPAQLPEGRPSYDFERMRKPTQNRTNDEMRVLEEAAIAQDTNAPTVVDGLLEPRIGGFDPDSSPVFGVIKPTAETIFTHSDFNCSISCKWVNGHQCLLCQRNRTSMTHKGLDGSQLSHGLSDWQARVVVVRTGAWSESKWLKDGLKRRAMTWIL